MSEQKIRSASDILGEHLEYMNGLERGQAMTRTETALRAIEQAQTEALEAFDKWLKHDGLCGIVGGYGYCTCGLDEARALIPGDKR